MVVEAEEHVEQVEEVEEAVVVVGVEANQGLYACTTMITTAILMVLISIRITRELHATRRDLIIR